MHESLGREAKSRRAAEHSLVRRKQEVEMLRGEIADLKVRVADGGGHVNSRSARVWCLFSRGA